MRAYLTAGKTGVMKASRDIHKICNMWFHIALIFTIVYNIKLFIVPIALIKRLIDGFLIENNWFTNLLDSFLFIVSVSLIFSRIYYKS